MLSYFLSAAVYALLLAACLSIWQRRLTGSGLATAIGTQLVWSIVLALEGTGERPPVGLSIGVEYLRELAWALVLTRCLRASAHPGTLRAIQRAVAALVLMVIVAMAGSFLLGETSSTSRFLERYGYWGSFALAIAGLVLVEQVARNTRSAHRWTLKYLWLGIGALYGWDLCLFSIAMLHGSAAEDFWVARGFVNALVGGLLAVGLTRIRTWESAAFLSPRVVFFNATLLAASLYVLAMAVGGYYIRHYGGSWGGAGQLLFLAAGALVLAVAVLSEQFRAWSRVTVAKYLFPYRYDYRKEWQKLTRALSESSETPLYDRIAQIVAGFVNSANGGLWLKDAGGAYVPAGGDLAPPSAPRETECREFFDRLLQNEWVCDLEEARSPPRANVRGPVLQPPAWMLANPRIWLIMPLICENALIGFVAIGQPLAAVRLAWEELDLLKAAGRQIASFLAFEQAAKRLAEAQQFEAIHRVSTVLMHDLRHLIAQQALVVQNAARHRGNPEFFDDAILTIDNSVKRMTRLMEELRSGVFTEQTHRIELAELCAESVKRCSGQEPTPVLEVHDRAVEVMASRERLLHVLEHVIRNGQDATPAGGTVTVRLRAVGPRATIDVADTGAGMDPEFIRQRLFRPFDTTKGERGFGIGAYEAREFVRKCGGSVEVQSAPGRGTTFTIHLPLAPALAPREIGMAHELRRAN
ncbi:MAG: XrtA/PEP-CTERM system histidine kinase PrsK [Steroidobacteraceae bacterium]